MFKVILARIQQKHRTMKYPAGAPPPMPDRFRGRPEIASSPCPEGCRACAEACPTGALALNQGGPPSIDLGKCLFCADCEEACPRKAVSFTRDYRLSTSGREDLLLSPGETELALAKALDKKMKRLFGRSLKLRQVSAGGCNACEGPTATSSRPSPGTSAASASSSSPRPDTPTASSSPAPSRRTWNSPCARPTTPSASPSS